MREKRDQENQDLYWFTLPHRLHPVLFQQAKNSTQDQQDQSNTMSITLAPSKTPLHPTTAVK